MMASVEQSDECHTKTTFSFWGISMPELAKIASYSYKSVVGKHGIWKENSNGHLLFLLTKSRELKLGNTNTVF